MSGRGVWTGPLKFHNVQWLKRLFGRQPGDRQKVKDGKSPIAGLLRAELDGGRVGPQLPSHEGEEGGDGD